MSKSPWDKDQILLKTAVPPPNLCTDVVEKLAKSKQLPGVVSTACEGEGQSLSAPDASQTPGKPGLIWLERGNPDIFVAQIISDGNERTLKEEEKEEKEEREKFQKEEIPDIQRKLTTPANTEWASRGGAVCFMSIERRL